jgi:shikimate kinase
MSTIPKPYVNGKNGKNGKSHTNGNGANSALLLPADQNLIITGYIGPNHSMIGQHVADRLRLRHVNVERQIEARAGMTPDEFRARYGETRLKTVETEVMQDVLLYRGMIIRISGQTLMHGDYSRRLAETGPVVCLVAALDAVLRRLHVSMGARYHNPHERALAIGSLKREWSVRKLDFVHELDTTYLADTEVVDAVIAMWQQVAVGV